MISHEMLKGAGWTPGRRLDDTELHNWIKKAVDRYDCHIFPEAVRIIREFGGLSLLHANIHFDPPHEISSVDGPVEWLNWEWEIGKILFPIAVDNYLEVYAVSSDGGIYSEGMKGTCFYENSLEEFLEIIARPDIHYRDVEMLEVYDKRSSNEGEEIYQEVQGIYRAIKN